MITKHKIIHGIIYCYLSDNPCYPFYSRKIISDYPEDNPLISFKINNDIMKYLQISKHPTYKENPFLEKAITEIQENTTKKFQWVKGNRAVMNQIVNNDGESIGHTALVRYIEVDEKQFAKVYLSQFAAFFELHKPAIRVFGYIINTIKPNSDSFILRMDDCLKYTGYSGRNHVLTGLSNLIEGGIIARSKYKDEFFLNPLVVFNGNRVTFAKTYVRKKIESKEQLKISFP